MKKGIIFGLICCIILVVLMFFLSINSYNDKKTVTLNKQQKIVIQPNQPTFSISDMQNQLGPEWKMIKLSEKRWYGPYKAKNGSGTRVAKGEIWIKVGNSKAVLESYGKSRSVGAGDYMFYPKTTNAVIFYRY